MQSINYPETISVSAITFGIIQITKQTKFNIPNVLLPYIALILAAIINAIWGFLMVNFDVSQFNFGQSLATGLWAGFGAIGGYQFLKPTFVNSQDKNIEDKQLNTIDNNAFDRQDEKESDGDV